MPNLTKEQLEQVKYVSIQDYCQRVDQIENIEDKLAFSTRYILSHGQDKNATVDFPIDKIIKVAHMKIADKSSDIKQLYVETEVNAGVGDVMVDPTVDAAEKDLGNQMFIANPVGYLKGQAKKLSDEIGKKKWMEENDIQAKINCGHLLHDVFTNEFENQMKAAIKKPTSFDVNVRLENAFGGPAALKKAYEATKPGVLARMFGRGSIASKNLDAAYQAFNNPNHALYGDLPTVQKAANEYLQHVLPNWKPNGSFNIPEPKDIAHLKGTQKERALFSMNLLKAAKQENEMNYNYNEMIEAAEKKNISFDQIPVNKDEKVAVDENQADFQNEVLKDINEEEAENNNNVIESSNEKKIDDLEESSIDLN